MQQPPEDSPRPFQVVVQNIVFLVWALAGMIAGLVGLLAYLDHEPYKAAGFFCLATIGQLSYIGKAIESYRPQIFVQLTPAHEDDCTSSEDIANLRRTRR